MNEWVERSIKLANEPGYLDKLHEVYPIETGGIRELDSKVRIQITKAFNAKNDEELIKTLLSQPIFPIKDPYVGFLKNNKKAIELNPKTVKRIASRLYRKGLEEVLQGIIAEKEANRQIGPLFHKWIPKLGYNFSEGPAFEKTSGIAFLKGSENQLKT
ncbi:restriction endonuclease, partial [candidate division WOR-3 bacterium]|nr:restriction endonuclease [candidate division WOR-3 bacterium]